MSLPLQSIKTPASDWALDPQVNILLVDDNVRNLDVLETILQIPEYRVIRATSGDEALLALMKDDFAAVVLDIQMPDMSGIELAKFIKQRRRSQHVPILFLTAIFHEDKDVLEGYGVGAVDYLTKPLNPQILKSKIAVFVELFRVSRALTRANTALEQQIDHRKDVHDALQQRNAELESRIQECTAELGRANSALAKANTSAAATAQANDEFLDTLSQELRAPLTPSMLLASNWEHDLSLPENVRQAFGSIRQALARQTRLVDDLFALTHLGRDQTQTMSVWNFQIQNRSRTIGYRNLKYTTTYYDGANNVIHEGSGAIPDEVVPGDLRTVSSLNDGLYPLNTVRYEIAISAADGYTP